MKVAIIADTHFGVRNDLPVFYPYMERFYKELFFPELERRKIKHLIHLGDLTDRRRYINHLSFDFTNRVFVDELVARDIKTEIIIGNHDCFWRTTNELNSLRNILKGHDKHFRIHETPQEADVFGIPALVLPWVNVKNYEETIRLLKKSRQKIVLGHLEITGFHMHRGVRCDHGLDPKLFARFGTVFTGHFHQKSHNKNVHYLGAPYEMEISDAGEKRGFHIYDTESGEIEFVQNTDPLYFKVIYDDAEPTPEIRPEWEGKYVRIAVTNKTNPYEFDQFVAKVEAMKPFKVSFDTVSIADNQTIAEEDTSDAMILDNTPTIVCAYVDVIEIDDVSKKLLKRMLLDIYSEATAKNSVE